jgi:hypothetical protein
MIHTGTIMDISKSKTYVFTKACDMVLIRTKHEYLLGQQVTFSNRDIVTNKPLLRMRNLSSSTHKVLAAAALLIVIIAAVMYSISGFGGKPPFDTACAAVISIDINPSIELGINKENKIIDVVFANDKGQEIFDQLNLKTKPINDGINQIVELAKAKGYLKASSTLFISAAPNSSGSDQSAELQLKEILKSAEKSNVADVVTVYIDDSRIINEAKASDISIGRLLLHKYAEDYGFSISLQEIKDSSISDIFVKLSLNTQTEPLLQQAANGDISPSSAPSDAASSPVTSDTAVTPSSEISSTAGPVVSSLDSGFTPKLTVTVSNGRMTFSWTPLSGASVNYNGTVYKSFKYYKVVASQTDATPIYPDDGYLFVGSDYDTARWSVNPSGTDYNQSPKLESGKKYYFAITYVFDNGNFTSNTVRISVPEYEDVVPDTAAAFSTPQLNVIADGNNLNFSWKTLPGSAVTYNGTTYKDFNYYKIVASLTNPTPIYPDDGYLYYASDLSTGSWSVDPSGNDYNKSPTLEAGKTYYFAITYVFSNGKFVSNTVQLTVP